MSKPKFLATDTIQKRVLFILAGSFIITAITLGILVAYNKRMQTPVIFSQSAMLVDMWNGYKAATIESGSNRTVDRQQNNISTSEGQSYTMLRAVWMDDRTTFDNSWKWTQDKLQRKDSLFSWRYGQLSDGSYGIQRDQGGYNTASDGDSDIALSLVMAYSRWGDKTYLDDAKPIISSIWQNEVVNVDGKPVLTANNLEKDSLQNVVVNVSYFSPYAYKIFASVDKSHDWTALSDNSYTVISQATRSNIDVDHSAGLPPDWITMNRQTGEIAAPSGMNTTNYGYDAIRTSWRLALDYTWFKDARAKEVLSEFSYLDAQWSERQVLNAVYKHDGSIVGDYETPAMYGASIGYFIVVNPDHAKQIYDTKLVKVYNPDIQSTDKSLGYYDTNWSWFGIALYQNALPNVTQVRQ